MWFLGADIGTTHVKVVGVTRDGTPLPALRRRTPVSEKDGLTFHDGSSIFAAVAGLAAEYACGPAAAHGPLGGLAIGAFGQEESVGLDARGGELQPSLAWWQTWPEPAVPAERAEWFDSFEHYRMSGLRYRPIQTPERLAYLRRARPEAWRLLAKWADLGSYVLWRLSGEWAASTTQLTHSQLFDAATLAPHEESMAALGVTPELFPAPLPPGAVVGPLLPDALPGVPLAPSAAAVMGGHDQVLAAYAATRAAGEAEVRAFDSIGTSEYLMALATGYAPQRAGYERGIDVEPSWRPGEYLLGCAVPSGKVLHLLANLFCGGDFDRLYAALAAEASPGRAVPSVTVSTLNGADHGLLSLSAIPAEATPATVVRHCADTLSDTALDALTLTRHLARTPHGPVALLGSLFERPEVLHHRSLRWPLRLLPPSPTEPVAAGAAHLAHTTLGGAS